MTRRAPSPLVRIPLTMGALLMALTGCTDPGGSAASPSDNLALSTRQHQLLEERMPDLARSMGAESLSALHEKSCRVEAPAKELAGLTSWRSQTAVHVPDETVAREVGRSLQAQAESQGFTTLPEDHKLVYSTLDPEYGETSMRRLEVADVDDADQHPRGRKPLPASTRTPAPTGPAEARPVREIGR